MCFEVKQWLTTLETAHITDTEPLTPDLEAHLDKRTQTRLLRIGLGIASAWFFMSFVNDYLILAHGIEIPILSALNSFTINPGAGLDAENIITTMIHAIACAATLYVSLIKKW